MQGIEIEGKSGAEMSFSFSKSLINQGMLLLSELGVDMCWYSVRVHQESGVSRHRRIGGETKLHIVLMKGISRWDQIAFVRRINLQSPKGFLINKKISIPLV